METLTLSSVVTAEMLQGILDQIYGLVPTVMPACLGYLGFRKAWSWLMGTLHTA